MLTIMKDVILAEKENPFLPETCYVIVFQNPSTEIFENKSFMSVDKIILVFLNVEFANLFIDKSKHKNKGDLIAITVNWNKMITQLTDRFNYALIYRADLEKYVLTPFVKS